MIARGLLRLAIGQADGIKAFGDTADAVAASLGPLIAFPLVTAALTALGGHPAFAAIGFLSRLCAVLALPVIVFEAARHRRVPGPWLRTVAALNWSFWPMLVLAVGVDTGVVFSGLTMAEAAPVLGMLLLYLVWYQWFILRAGLALGAAAALGLVLINDAVIVALSTAPLLFSGLLHVQLA